MLVTIEQNSWRHVSARLREVPGIEHLAFVGGDVDLVMLVRTADNASLRDIVLARVHALEGVRSTPDLAHLRRDPGAPHRGRRRGAGDLNARKAG